jgi:16S rRNA (cytosine1402-N4)-methyltransferase
MICQYKHESVLFEESIEALSIKPQGKYVDATFGRGGHTKGILSVLDQCGEMVAFDRDQAAIEYGQSVVDDTRLTLIHSNYEHIANHLEINSVDGVLVDCGLSSPQLDEADRGFSFLKDAGWVNSAKEEEIADVLYWNADERRSRRIAKAICQARSNQQILTTKQLSDIVASVAKREGKAHPATKTFQAIRVMVNDEYGSLERFLENALNILKPGGRLVMISFHSTEHKIIKRFIQMNRPGNENLKRGLQTLAVPRVKRIGRVIKPSLQEIRFNTRSRSAQLRIVEKIA